MKHSKQAQAIDWEDVKRFMRQRWIARIRFVRTPYVLNGKNCVCIPRRMKSLLTVLESHARDRHSCDLKHQTIAIAMGAGVRTAIRAIEDCQAFELLTVEPSFYSGRASKFIISWTKIAQILLADQATASLVPMNDVEASEDDDTSATVTDVSDMETSATVTETSATVTETYATVTETYATVSQNCGSSTPSYAGAQSYLQSCSEAVNKPSCGEVGFGQGSGKEPKNSWSEKNPETGDAWPVKITIIRLMFGSAVQELWEHAFRQPWGLVREDRLRFFTLARCLVRIDGGKRGNGKQIRDVAALFTYLIKKRRWQGLSADEDWAKDQIEKADAGKRKKSLFEPEGTLN